MPARRGEPSAAHDAFVAGRRYAVPGAFAPVPPETVRPGESVRHAFSIQFLWRDSTVNQFGLATGLDLSSLLISGTDEAARLGLRSLEPLDPADQARGRRLFSDGPPASLAVLMRCEASVSCQMWRMQDEAVVETTFDKRFLPDWSSMRRSAAALLTHMQLR